MSPYTDSDYQEHVQRRLSELVADHLTKRTGAPTKTLYSPLQINDYSICFSIHPVEPCPEGSLYVKLPKKDISKRQILPVTARDRSFALDEYESLLQLGQHWDGQDLGVQFVEPVLFAGEYNAIITKKVSGEELFRRYRRSDLRRKLTIRSTANTVHQSFVRIGKALSAFHRRFSQDAQFHIQEALPKMTRYCGELESFGVDRDFMARLVNNLNALHDYSTPAQLTYTLKGLDVRNAIIDRGGDVSLLDPGRIKTDYREADVARFLATSKILYWGSVLLFFRFCPDQSYEQCFLRGYYGESQAPHKLLGILLVKELLKHWRMAHTSLHLKPWPQPFKWFLRKTYIDPFYKKEISLRYKLLGP